MAEDHLTTAEALGRAVKVRRADLGLQRKELAQRAKLSYPYISEIENGAKEPSTKALRKIAAALELEDSELLELASRYRGLGDDHSTRAGQAHEQWLPIHSSDRPSALYSLAMEAPSAPRRSTPEGSELENRLVRRISESIATDLREEIRSLVREEVEAAFDEREGRAP